MSRPKIAPKKLNSATKPTSKPQKPAKEPKIDAKDDGKDKKQRSFRLPDDALNVLKEVTAKRKQHGLSQEAFIAEAIYEHGRKVLKDAFPALRNAPAEYVAARLEYLERIIIKQRWQKLANSKAASILAPDLTSMIQKFQFEPHAVDMEKADAWRKEHGKGKIKKFKEDDVIMAAYALKLGLLTENDDE
jgi:hypothetical protein